MIDGAGTLLSPKSPQDSVSANLEKLLSADFQQLDNLLSETALAAWLLGYDAARDQIFAALRLRGISLSFAEGDLSVPGTVATGAFSLAEGDEKKPSRRRKARLNVYGPNEKAETAADITAGDITPFGLRFDVPPREAIDYFKRKQVLPADEFYQLEAEARSGAFAIGKVYKTDVTTALQTELIRALETGETQQAVIKKLKDILSGAGHKMLGDAHLETVFRTTTQMAYGVGRRTAQEEAAEYLPYWEYSAVGDDRTRPHHRALDGLIYPANHEFWNKYYPPWDFRCRCTVIPVFDYQKGYDPKRPNSETVIEYDAEGMPSQGNVSGTPVTIRKSDFSGVPRQTSLGQVLTTAAERALDARSK